MDHDKLVNVPPKAVAKATFRLLSRLTRHPPHIQAAGAAAVFVLICEHHRVNPQDVMSAVKNLMAFDRGQIGRREEFGAVRDYLRYDVPRL